MLSLLIDSTLGRNGSSVPKMNSYLTVMICLRCLVVNTREGILVAQVELQLRNMLAQKSQTLFDGITQS